MPWLHLRDVRTLPIGSVPQRIYVEALGKSARA
jgi:hypothetical protein